MACRVNGQVSCRSVQTCQTIRAQATKVSERSWSGTNCRYDRTISWKRHTLELGM